MKSPACIAFPDAAARSNASAIRMNLEGIAARTSDDVDPEGVRLVVEGQSPDLGTERDLRDRAGLLVDASDHAVFVPDPHRSGADREAGRDPLPPALGTSRRSSQGRSGRASQRSGTAPTPPRHPRRGRRGRSACRSPRRDASSRGRTCRRFRQRCPPSRPIRGRTRSRRSGRDPFESGPGPSQGRSGRVARSSCRTTRTLRRPRRRTNRTPRGKGDHRPLLVRRRIHLDEAIVVREPDLVRALGEVGRERDAPRLERDARSNLRA